MIYVDNPVQQTWIFSALLGLALLLSLRKRKDRELFPISITQELKGFAILVIVFAHIGYSLSSDSWFLWPLSNLAGVGVNIFLFVSGYGLTSSSIRRKLSIRQFYTRRLKKLYIPFWLTLGLYFLLDYCVLHRSYATEYITNSFAGIFRTADVTKDIDSPLWYFTMIAFYYLLYPLVFSKKRPWVSAMIIFAATYYVLHHTYIADMDTARFYKVYTAAFPLGIIASWLHHNRHKYRSWAKKALKQVNKSVNVKSVVQSKLAKKTLYYALVLGLLGAVVYSRTYASPWDTHLKEQTVNVLTMFALVAFFMLKRLDIRLFYIFGVYSYEIYLLHWPLMSRYDIVFKHVPAWAAVVLYLFIFLLLGRVLSRLPDLFIKHIKKPLTKIIK